MSKTNDKPQSDPADETADVKAQAPKASKPRVLAESKTHRVMTDDVRVWKEAKE